jgi:hypothetical protein
MCSSERTGNWVGLQKLHNRPLLCGAVGQCADREKRSLVNLQKLHNRPDQREAMVDPDISISMDIAFEKKLTIKRFYKSIIPIVKSN